MEHLRMVPRRFEIHFRRSEGSRDDYSLIAKDIRSLEEAKAKRNVGGDLVVDAFTHRVVDDSAWLFDWEKAKPNCYAKRAMKLG